MRFLIVSFVAACASVPRPPPPPVDPVCASAPGTTQVGYLHGIVTDGSTGVPLEGVTVIVTSPATPHNEAAITDVRGAYKLALPPGLYLALFYYVDVELERADVPVRAGCDTPLFQRITATPRGNETIL